MKNNSIKVTLRIKPSNSSLSQSWMQVYRENNEISLKKQKKRYLFKFDTIFSPETTQKTLYKCLFSPLIDEIFNGFNTTIMAYGQTGSGKTYTMGTSKKQNEFSNNEEEIGILPRAIKDIWDKIYLISNEKRVVVRISFFEIYNEEILDLLKNSDKMAKNEKNKITVRETKENGIILLGLNEIEVNSYAHVLQLLYQGNTCRTSAPTLMNESSSRSHAIFSINFEHFSIEKTDEETNNINNNLANTKKTNYLFSKLHLVDLAGSERMKRTGSQGKTMKEGIHINKGLLALGNVINSLSKLSQNGKTKRVSCFRDSKLTRILQDSLGGNSLSYMIACISAEENDFEETLSTLYYANKAKLIQNKPVANEDASSIAVQALNQEIFALKNEIIQFKRFISSDQEISKRWKQRNFGSNSSFLQEKGKDSQENTRDFDENDRNYNENYNKNWEMSEIFKEVYELVLEKKAAFEKNCEKLHTLFISHNVI